jgi:hypothetical protein
MMLDLSGHKFKTIILRMRAKRSFVLFAAIATAAAVAATTTTLELLSQQYAYADPAHCSGQECYNAGYNDGCAYSSSIDTGKGKDPSPPGHHSPESKQR